MKKLILFVIFGILLISVGIAKSNNINISGEINKSVSEAKKELNETIEEAKKELNETITKVREEAEEMLEEAKEEAEEFKEEINKTKQKLRKNITFVPWQKRNESECIEGCKCVGAVTSCITETGKTMTITAGRSGNVITITVNKTEVNTTLEIEQEITVNNKTRLKAKIKSGEYVEIKIMPDTASERAIEVLKLKVCSEENNCTIELKEVVKDKEIKVSYEMRAEKHVKVFGLFKTKMHVKTQIDAENGTIIEIKRPWWSFLASETKK